MNRIDQALMIFDAHTLDSSFFPKNILDLGVNYRDRDKGVEGVLHIDDTGDDGSYDTATVTCQIFCSDDPNPSDSVQTVFTGTIAEFKELANGRDKRLRTGLINRLKGRYVSVDLYASVDCPMLCSFWLEAVD